MSPLWPFVRERWENVLLHSVSLFQILWRQFLKFKETELPAKEADKHRSKLIYQSFEVSHAQSFYSIIFYSVCILVSSINSILLYSIVLDSIGSHSIIL